MISLTQVASHLGFRLVVDAASSTTDPPTHRCDARSRCFEPVGPGCSGVPQSGSGPMRPGLRSRWSPESSPRPRRGPFLPTSRRRVFRVPGGPLPPPRGGCLHPLDWLSSQVPYKDFGARPLENLFRETVFPVLASSPASSVELLGVYSTQGPMAGFLRSSRSSLSCRPGGCWRSLSRPFPGLLSRKCATLRPL